MTYTPRPLPRCVSCGGRVRRGGDECWSCAKLAAADEARQSPVPAGYYAVSWDPLGACDPLRIYTAPELQRAVNADTIPAGALVERQDGALFRLAADGKLEEMGELEAQL